MPFCFAVILSATSSNVKFRGFLIQSRTSGGSTNAGMFVDNGDDQRITCDHNVSVHLSIKLTILAFMYTLYICTDVHFYLYA